MRPFRHIVDFIRLWESRDAHRVRRLADIKQPGSASRHPPDYRAPLRRAPPAGHDPAAAARVCVPPPNGGPPVAMANQRRLGSIFDIRQRQPPSRQLPYGGIPGNNGMMQRIAFAPAAGPVFHRPPWCIPGSHQRPATSGLRGSATNRCIRKM